MKKLILILTFLILPVLCFSSSIQDKHRAVIAKKSAAADPCPAGTYMFAYNGDYTADTHKACFTNGDANKDGTETDPGTNITVSADYVEYDAVNAYLQWAVSGEDGIKDNEGTIYFSVYFVEDGGIGTDALIEVWVDNENSIRIVMVAGSASIVGYFEANNVAAETYSTVDPSANTWYRVGYAWKVGEAGNDHSISCVTLGSAHSWDDDDDDLDATAWTPSSITIGEDLSFTAVDDTNRIKDLTITSDFKGTDIWDQQ